MKSNNYSFSFTTSSIRRNETSKLVELYVLYKDWKTVQEYVVEHNVLQQKTTRSSRKIYGELVSRLRQLSESELSLLAHCSETEKSILLWVAVCRRYHFIHDFSVEVIREHLFFFKSHLTHGDFDVFFNAKSIVHDNVENLTLSTRRKVKQVIFKMLQEVDLIDGDGRLNIILPSQQLLALMNVNELESIGIPTFYRT